MLSRNSLRILCGLSALLLGAGQSPLLAEDIHVPADQPTIQAGIDAAAEGDVVILADATYTGEGNKNLDFRGKAITIRSESNDPTRCLIDCQQDGRGFNFHSGETSASTLSGLTIQNGQVSDAGGGIYCSNSSPTVTHCIFSGNSVTTITDLSVGGGSPDVTRGKTPREEV
jgi:hypothetical protein